jgi:dTDP-4-dehydrorhamnose reductase
MLGSELSRVAKHAGLEVLEISRSGSLRFDARQESFTDFSRRIAISEDDFLVNAIGWIPQKSLGNLVLDEESANLLNSKLVEDIAEARAESGFRWLQIGTDCVFSGEVGNYNEESLKDAQDLYGVSKISGERFCADALLVRCSIIGQETSSSFGLYSWFKAATQSGPVKGFKNHMWNGVTTTVFAKLAVGLFESQLRSCHQHFIPGNQLSKFQLLRLFEEGLDVPTYAVEPFAAPTPINRTLSTLNRDQNQKFWKLAGYDVIPDIDLYVREMIQVDSERGA